MARSWTFGRKVGMGFAAVVGLAVVIAAVAVFALRSTVEGKDRVIETYGQNLIDIERLRTSAEQKVAAYRGFLLSREEGLLDAAIVSRSEFIALLGRLRTNAATDEGRRLLELIERSEADHQAASERAVALRKTDAAPDAAVRLFSDEVKPKRDAMDRHLDAFGALGERLRNEAKQAATDAADAAVTLLVFIAVGAALVALAVAFQLTRGLTRQIGSAVQHIQSSSSELQVAANQQAAGAKEHATAMSEITTTISELLATSRQIAESAQRVAHIAGETAGAAGNGDRTVQRVQESIAGIKRQVDVIVNHMLDLGRKSQQIGGVLEVVNELAEQTNILAINATIEAAGAGEAGKRFAVVADEIRRLADRVGGSTKEIRGLIEEVRAAVNATVMATESGAKSVDAGARQYTDVAAAFQQIAGLVGTTTEAAREIELSTKQQSTAVEQVNSAVSNVAQATKESEVSTAQTLQTATQLASLSGDLTRLIHPQAAA